MLINNNLRKLCFITSTEGGLNENDSSEDIYFFFISNIEVYRCLFFPFLKELGRS